MTIEELAERIYEGIKDYRNHDNVFITQQNIFEWVEQSVDDKMLG